MKHNSVGAGETMKLGRGKPEGLAKAGKAQRVVKPAGDEPKVARPGGPEKAPPAAGSAPKVARPGGAQRYSKRG